MAPTEANRSSRRTAAPRDGALSAMSEAGWAGGVAEALLAPTLTATYWFDSGELTECDGPPYAASIRFFGRRIGTTGQRGDRFEQVETVSQVLPGSGPVSVTTRVSGVNAGEWTVRAMPVSRKGQVRVRAHPGPPATGAVSPKRLLWSRGNPVSANESGTRVRTRWSALVSAPGVVPGCWAAWVALGVLVALGLQAILAARSGLDVGAVGAGYVIASMLGALGARAWFVVLNRGVRRRPSVVLRRKARPAGGLGEFRDSRRLDRLRIQRGR
ncbi:MAG: hypothetical protein DLM62_15290 [Pseudonocardiales bacterium]|nr:MAG: hypothetical protein DLM62_15290 [Pseudonocardiales bacterium]